MKFSFHSSSNIGAVRETNQDYIYSKEISTNVGKAYMGIVCDGMGGLSSGEVASTTAVNIFADWFKKEFKYVLSGDNLFEALKNQWDKLISDARTQLVQYSSFSGQKMGTTLSVLLIVSDKFYAAQIGDSRIYLLREGNLTRVTTDHSYVMELASRGLMTYDEANLAKEKNVLTRCLGSMDAFGADYYEGSVYENDFFLISSDGFHGGKTDAEMCDIITRIYNCTDHERKYVLEEAIEQKILGGERDNISAVCVRLKE